MQEKLFKREIHLESISVWVRLELLSEYYLDASLEVPHLTERETESIQILNSSVFFAKSSALHRNSSETKLLQFFQIFFLNGSIGGFRKLQFTGTWRCLHCASYRCPYVHDRKQSCHRWSLAQTLWGSAKNSDEREPILNRMKTKFQLVSRCSLLHTTTYIPVRPFALIKRMQSSAFNLSNITSPLRLHSGLTC